MQSPELITSRFGKAIECVSLCQVLHSAQKAPFENDKENIFLGDNDYNQ